MGTDRKNGNKLNHPGPPPLVRFLFNALMAAALLTLQPSR